MQPNDEKFRRDDSIEPVVTEQRIVFAALVVLDAQGYMLLTSDDIIATSLQEQTGLKGPQLGAVLTLRNLRANTAMRTTPPAHSMASQRRGLFFDEGTYVIDRMGVRPNTAPRTVSIEKGNDQRKILRAGHAKQLAAQKIVIEGMKGEHSVIGGAVDEIAKVAERSIEELRDAVQELRDKQAGSSD